MNDTDSPWILLDLVARDLAAVLDRGLLPRTLRPEARRLLMAAWLALKGPRRVAERKSAVTLARRLDGLVAIAATDGVPAPSPGPGPDRLGIADRLLASARSPLQQRIAALEGSIDALARRTRRMVEHAEATAGREGARAPVAGSPPPDGGRQSMELVWGDADD